jgi:DNA polymerase-3 subunit epsilon/ATP-dependent DNA helicase DinG
MSERVYVALDLETTGLDAGRDAIIEVGAVRIEDGRMGDRFSTLINPRRPISLFIQQITGIRNEDVAAAPVLEEVIPELLGFVGADVRAVIAHNAAFDLGFLRAAGVNFHRPALDTFELAPILLPGMGSYALGELCRVLDIRLDDAHRALADAEATARLFLALLARLEELPVSVLETVVAHGRNVNWPPLDLFEAALRARPADGGPRPRTDLRTRYGPDWEKQTPPLPPPATLIDDGGPPPASVDPVWIERVFGAEANAPGTDRDDLDNQRTPGPSPARDSASDSALARLMGAGYELRPGQVQMARRVLDALNQGDHLIIEAGTGVGKSLAYLVPAGLWSVANQRRVVIATNTIALQDQLIEKDIPQVRELLADLDVGDLQPALLKGRSNYLCTRRLDAWRNSHPLNAKELSMLAKVLVWLTVTEDGDVNGLFIPSSEERAIWRRICSDGATCNPARCGRPGQRDYYLEARQRADAAHLLVVNHALLMADIGTGERILPPYAHLIVDEAHRLEDAATDQLTYRVSWPAVQARLARLSLAGDLLSPLLDGGALGRDSTLAEWVVNVDRSARRAASALTRFADMLRQFVLDHKDIRNDSGYAQRLSLDSRLRSQPMWSQIEIEWDQTTDHLRATLRALDGLLQHLHAGGWASREPDSTRYDALRGVEGELGDLLANMDMIILQTNPLEARETVAWVEIDVTDRRREKAGDVTLYAAPRHVGQTLEASLVHQRRTAIFTGATLRTGGGFGFIRDRLGLWDADAATVESPFDYKRNALLYLPNNIPAPNQPGYQQAVEEAILMAAQAAGGRTMVLFTSYAQLRTTAAAIRAPLDRLGVAVLQHGTSSRNRLLREYRRSDRAVLLGARSFWEGIDLPGEQLSVLIIARLPFATPSDPLVAARSQEFENPFRDYTLPDAVLRFRQGFGRLIRRADDRGVVVVLDSRVWRKSYGQTFLEALPPCTTRNAPLANLGAEIDLWLNRR